MRSTATRLRVCLAFAPLLLAPPAAVADEAEDIRSSIVVRCIYHAGEFGRELFDICVSEDTAAAEALQKYPPQSAAIIARCTERLMDAGWVRIRMCADEEMEAAADLDAYVEEYKPWIAHCQASLPGQGPVKVKACVDKLAKEKGY